MTNTNKFKTTYELERAIADALQTTSEDTRIPDAIALYADKRAGKPVNSTDGAKLTEQLGVNIRVSKRYGMTQMVWAAHNGQEHSLLISHGDTNIKWPTGAELKLKSPAYFAARDERNIKRHAAMSEHLLMDRVRTVNPSAVEKAAHAIKALCDAQAALDALIDYGKPLSVIRYEIMELVKGQHEVNCK